jgi:ferredoxin
MKLEITDTCTGHGRCYMIAPDLFDDDDSGYGIVKHGGIVPPELEIDARTAVSGCPESAIRIVES